MKIYKTKQELYDDCMKSEKSISIIPKAIFSEENGELIGYIKDYV